jgi:hypothetical protein
VAEQAENKLQAPQFPSTDKIKMTGGQKVEVHEIKIAIFYEIEITIMRSKLYLFMRSKLTIIFSQF